MSLSFSREALTDWLKHRLGDKCGEWQELIGCQINGRTTAVVGYAHFDGRDIDMTLAVDGRATPDFLLAAFAYPFTQLGCARVTCHVSDKNDRSLSIVRRLGFVKEGVKRNGMDDGDALVFGMLRAECRFI